MNLSFHPNASENFNREGETLLQSRVEYSTRASENFKTDRHAIRLPANYGDFMNIKVPEWEDAKDSEMRPILILQRTKLGGVGLTYDAFERFEALVAKIQKTPVFRSLVSLKNVRDSVASWLSQRSRNQTEENLCDFIVAMLQPTISQMEVWVPLAATYIEGEVDLGHVKICPVSQSLCDSLWSRMAKYWSEQNPAELPVRREMFEEFRQKVQGFAACVLTAQGDDDTIKSYAYQSAYDAASYLRCFSPANLDPQGICLTMPLGQENSRRTYYFNRDAQGIDTIFTTLEDMEEWFINKNQLQEMKSRGLSNIHEMLTRSDRTPFMNSLLTALALYGKSCSAHQLADKLLYIVTPLESILVKDSNEGLTQNVAERMALIIADDADARIVVAENYRKVYALRSKFVHHGEGVQDTENMKVFMRNAFTLFQFILSKAGEFQSKDEFLRAVDRLKFSAGSF